MRRGSKLLVAGVLLAQGMLAWAASFDCRKAVRPQEKAICSNAALEKADEQMAVVYRGVRERLSATGATAIRDDQRIWLQWLATVCEAAKEKDTAKLAACMLGTYKERIGVLGKTVERRKDGLVVYTRSVSLADPDDEADKADTTITSEEVPGFGTLRAAWPQVDSSDAEWLGWNAAVERAALRLVSGKNDGLWTTDLAGDADQEVSVKLVLLTPGVVSIRVTLEMNGHGAAHPNESWEGMHWLRRERRELVAEDVFRTGTPWKQVLAKQCWEPLTLDLGEYLQVKGPGEQALLDVVGAPKNWSFDQKGLAIGFPEYSVSPRVAPASDVTVPWALLRPYLAAASPVGR